MTARNVLPFRARETDGNDAIRHLREKAPHDPMLPNEISEELIEASRQRAREMVFSVIVFAFAIIGAAWSLGYLVGTVAAMQWWAA